MSAGNPNQKLVTSDECWRAPLGRSTITAAACPTNCFQFNLPNLQGRSPLVKSINTNNSRFLPLIVLSQWFQYLSVFFYGKLEAQSPQRAVN